MRAKILLLAAVEAMVQGGRGGWTVVPDRGPRVRDQGSKGQGPRVQRPGPKGPRARAKVPRGGRKWSWRKRSRSRRERKSVV